MNPLYQSEAKAQWREPKLEGAIRMSLTFYFGTKRGTDLDNFNQHSLDALTRIVYGDDSQIAELHLKRAYGKSRPTHRDFSVPDRSGGKRPAHLREPDCISLTKRS